MSYCICYLCGARIKGSRSNILNHMVCKHPELTIRQRSLIADELGMKGHDAFPTELAA